MQTLKQFEEGLTAHYRQYLQVLLGQTNGNVTEAARMADTHRSHLQRLMRRHGVKSALWRRREGENGT